MHTEKITVWWSSCAGGIIGPYFFKDAAKRNVTVNGECYRAPNLHWWTLNHQHTYVECKLNRPVLMMTINYRFFFYRKCKSSTCCREMLSNFFFAQNAGAWLAWHVVSRRRTWHTARVTMDLLRGEFGELFISGSGPVNWPRSCDLTPLDYMSCLHRQARCN